MLRERNSMEHKVTFGRLLNYDLKNSLIQNRWRWAGAIALFFFLAHVITDSLQIVGKEPGISGIFLYLIKGAAPYARTENSSFELPVLWFLYHSYFFCLIGDYPVKDLQGYGKQVFLRIADRKKWWLSKCVWITVSAAIYEILFLIVSFLYLAVNAHNISIHTDASFQMIGMQSAVATAGGIFAYLGATIWTGWFQFYLSLIMGPVLAVSMTLTLQICACYFYTPLLPGNFMMLDRTCGLNQNGFFLLIGAAVLTVFSVAVVWLGAEYMKKYQLMK